MGSKAQHQTRLFGHGIRGLAPLVVLVASLLLVQAPTAGAVTGPPEYPMADPDTLPTSGSDYITIGTTTRGIDGCGVADDDIIYVPVIQHGSGENLTLAGCATWDLLPNGPGSQANQNCSDIWAPSAAYFAGKAFLFYTASDSRSGCNQAAGDWGERCIFRAISESGSILGPYTNPVRWHCPGGARADNTWAIDPDVFVDGGNLYVTFREGGEVSNTNLRVVQVDSAGSPLWNTMRVLLTAGDVGWADGVIENSSMMRISTGSETKIFLFFSGGYWGSSNYATGIADCGSSVTTGQDCGFVSPSRTNQYFGYSGSSPYRQLPLNKEGPGGMSLFRTHGGQARVVWHYLIPDNLTFLPYKARTSLAESLQYSPSNGFVVP